MDRVRIRFRWASQTAQWRWHGGLGNDGGSALQSRALLRAGLLRTKSPTAGAPGRHPCRMHRLKPWRCRGSRGRPNPSISRFVRGRSRAISQEMRVQGRRRQSLHSDTVPRACASYCVLKGVQTRDERPRLARARLAGWVPCRRWHPASLSDTRDQSTYKYKYEQSLETAAGIRNGHAWMTRINKHGVSGITREGATTSTCPRIGQNIDT